MTSVYQPEVAVDRRREFGTLLRAQRKQRALTLERVASLAGVSRPYLSELERGLVKHPGSDVLRSVVGFYGVSHDNVPEAWRGSLSVEEPSERVKALPLFDNEVLTDNEVQELRRHLKLIRGKLLGNER